MEPIIVFLAYTACFLAVSIVAGGGLCLVCIAIDRVREGL